MTKSYNDNETYSIHKNPDLKDYGEIVREHNEKNPRNRKTLKNIPLRAILDLNNKCLFVFDGDLLHQHAIPSLVNKLSDNFIHLSGRFDKGKFDCSMNFNKNELGENYEWIRDYLTGFSVK